MENRNPVEILHAKVEGYESVPVGDESVLTLTVIYRSDSGSILGGGQTPRGKLWVAEDGTVLKQTAYLFGSQLTFERASGERTEEIHKESYARSAEFDRHDQARRVIRNRGGGRGAFLPPVNPKEPPAATGAQPQVNPTEPPAGNGAEQPAASEGDSQAARLDRR